MSYISDDTQENLIDREERRLSRKVLFMTFSLVVTGAASVAIFKYQTKRQDLPKMSISLQTFFVLISLYINFLIFFIKITIRPTRLSEHFRKYRNLSMANGKDYIFAKFL